MSKYVFYLSDPSDRDLANYAPASQRSVVSALIGEIEIPILSVDGEIYRGREEIIDFLSTVRPAQNGTSTLYVWRGCNACKDILETFNGRIVYVGEGNDPPIFNRISPNRTVPVLALSNQEGQITNVIRGCNAIKQELRRIGSNLRPSTDVFARPPPPVVNYRSGQSRSEGWLGNRSATVSVAAPKQKQEIVRI